MAVAVTFVGCGDAFGSGGRLNTCFHVEAPDTRFLIDCGASSLPGLKRLGLDLNAIDTILITHFHADHFGGLPFLLLDARLMAKRTRPLTLAGPPGIEAALRQFQETCFPGSSTIEHRFPLTVRALEPGRAARIGALAVLPLPVNHGRPGGPYLAYRLEVAGRTIAYSGDTEWTEALVEAGRDADLFVAEAYYRDRAVTLHLDLATLERHLPRIRPRRLLLTHMSDDMLRHPDRGAFDCAEDGLRVVLE